MDAFWDWLAGTELAFQIGATWWFPLIESLHVVALAVVVGSIFFVDLRLLGWMGMRYPLTVFTRELPPWAWGGFVVAFVTGLGMFVTRPAAYAANPAFLIKLGLLVVAGANVFVLHRRVLVATTDGSPAAKRAGLVSILVWVGVIVAGRWTGHIN